MRFPYQSAGPMGDRHEGESVSARACELSLFIEHAKQNSDRAYLGRKPSFTREQFVKVRATLGQQTLGIAQIAKDTGLTRQTVYRIKGDPAGAEGALVAAMCSQQLSRVARHYNEPPFVLQNCL
jgi:hypothetical protein